MIVRITTSELLRWKELKNRKPLLVRGARQVGKTFTIRAFGRSHFAHVAEVNFELQPELRTVFSRSLNPGDIIGQLAPVLGVPIEPGRSLLFLDEIQAAPQAITSLRYFYEKMPELHVIAAGSLLEFALDSEDISMPVGRIQPFFMGPLCFDEFLLALGEELFRHFIVDEVTLTSEISDALHQKGLSLLRKFTVVGGMPEAVESYIDNPGSLEYRRAQTALMQTFRDDFGKYASRAKHKYLEKVFLTAPGMVSRRYVYREVDPDTPSRDLKEAVALLEKAGVLSRIRASSGAGLPLEAHVHDRRYKLAFLDVGLVQAALGLDAVLALSSDFSAINSGALAEQFVAQELLTSAGPYEKGALYYWERPERGSSAEVDFLYQVDKYILPLEVKSGATGRLKSMRLFLDKYQAPFGIRISQHGLSFYDHILSVPFYLTPVLSRLTREALKR